MEKEREWEESGKRPDSQPRHFRPEKKIEKSFNILKICLKLQKQLSFTDSGKEAIERWNSESFIDNPYKNNK